MKTIFPSPRAVAAATFVLACSVAADASAQNDLSIVAITSPTAGCTPVGSENVKIRMFNYGSTLPAGTSFNAAYSINAGAPVTELVVLGSPLISNSTFAYTFTTQADVSVPGTYTFDATVAIAGDINPTNNAYTGWSVTTLAASESGTVSGPATPAPSGTLALSGYNGSVVQWEESDDGGLRWFVLANTQPTQDYADLRAPAQFRARVQHGQCPAVVSNAVTVSP